MRDQIQFKKNDRGFTLVELLIAVSVLAILVSFALPNIGEWMSRYRVRSSARRIASNMQFARIKSITENNDYIVCFETASDLYTIIDDNDGDGVDGVDCANSSGDDIIVKTVNLPTGVVFGYSSGAKKTPHSCSSGGACATLSDSVSFSGDDVNFNPDGSAENGYVYVKNELDETHAVGVPNAATGNVQVWRLSPGTNSNWGRQ